MRRISKGGKAMISRISKEYPLLTIKQEKELAARIKDGDEDAFEILTMSNIKLVVTIAQPLSEFGLEIEDLMQEGYLGLLKAARKYDPIGHPNVKFSTYASWWIRQSLYKFINENKLIKIPTSTEQKIRKVKKMSETMDVEEIVENVNFSESTVRRLMELDIKTVSIDSFIKEGEDGMVNEFIFDQEADTPSDSANREGADVRIVDMLNSLNDREQIVVKMRLGLNEEGEAFTLEEVKKVIKVSRERVRQIQKKAFKKMRKFLEERNEGRSAVEVSHM